MQNYAPYMMQREFHGNHRTPLDLLLVYVLVASGARVLVRESYCEFQIYVHSLKCEEPFQKAAGNW